LEAGHFDRGSDVKTLVLKARGVSDSVLEVPPGRYLVTAKLPDGQETSSDDIVNVESGGNVDVVLSLSDLQLPASCRTRLQSRLPYRTNSVP